jgi:hypothetical protein
MDKKTKGIGNSLVVLAPESQGLARSLSYQHHERQIRGNPHQSRELVRPNPH